MQSANAVAALLVCLVVGSVAVPAGVASASPPTSPSAFAHSDDPPTLHQQMTVSRNADPDTVTAVLEYDVPSSVTRLTVDVPALTAGEARVVSTSGFDQTDGAAFEWDGRTDDPTITLHVSVGESLTRGVRGVEGDDWAFLIEPNTAVSWHYRGTAPAYTQDLSVDGEGYVRSHMAYMGTHGRRIVTLDGETVTFVVGGNASEVNLTRTVGFLETAHQHFNFGVVHDESTVFVLPLASSGIEHVAGATVKTAFWVTRAGTALDSPGAVFSHEYVHTRLGPVGEDDAAWLNEAAPEYFGRVFALNYGAGTYGEFYETTTTETYAPNRTSVVLSDVQTWHSTLGNYEKGAHVLAALDAEIRRRTDGAHTLMDVFVSHPEPFESHAEFARTVVAVTGDDSLRSWLDVYVTTDALPPMPDDPSRYVVGPELDPDADALASGEETDAGTNPFVGDTDGDGLDDGRELDIGTNPAKADTDGDGLSDAEEVAGKTDPTRADTDGDGRDDAEDVYPTDAERWTETPTATATATATTTPTTGTKTGTTAPGFGVGVAVIGLVVAFGRLYLR